MGQIIVLLNQHWYSVDLLCEIFLFLDVKTGAILILKTLTRLPRSDIHHLCVEKHSLTHFQCHLNLRSFQIQVPRFQVYIFTERLGGAVNCINEPSRNE